MDTTRPAAIEPDQVECDPPEDGQILGAMPDADAAGAQAVLERLVASSRGTCSIGVAERLADESASGVLRRADEALYSAKRDGGGRIAIAA